MSYQDLVGRTLGQYELHELLGIGGMGAVYRGAQASLRREVAIKVLSPELAGVPGYVDRFTREAQTAAALEHRHIVPIYDYGMEQSISYVVMRLLTGGTLSQRIKELAEAQGALPSLREVSDCLFQVADALDYAHSKGVIHRDIKPTNVMFDAQGSAYLVDFGLAKLLQATTALTGTGMAMGTPLYMSPEQWRSEELTPAADQYAVGVMAYALVTGRPPFESPTPYGLMHKHLNEPPTPAHAIRADVPPQIPEVLERAIAKRSTDRYPTVMAFARAFDEAVKDEDDRSTGFFTAPVKVVTMPTRAPAGEPTAYPRTRPATPGLDEPTVYGRRKPVYRSPVMWAIVGVLIVALVVLLAVTSSGGGDSDSGQPAPTTGAALEGSETPTPQSGIVILSSPTPETGEGTQAAELLLLTLSPSPTPITPVTPTEIALLTTEEPTLTPTETPDLQATAAAWTATPTLDLNATAEMLVIQGMTATAESWTATPTPTDTPTSTLTPTATATFTPTPTATFTATPTATATYTPTPTATPTTTPTPTYTPSPTLSPTPAYFPLGSRNLDWKPVIEEFKEVPFVLVPPGCFRMGATDSVGLAHEAPIHEICLSAFWISQTEITNDQYRECVDDGACEPLIEPWYYDEPYYGSFPVTFVDWARAAQYAAWIGGSLPTEAQWEYAARGPESWSYAWGNTFDGVLANYCDSTCEYDWRDTRYNDGWKDMAPVGSFPGGASWVGALDMTGNMWEWTNDWYDAYRYSVLVDGAVDPIGPASGSERVLRGGSWTDEPKNIRAAFRFKQRPDNRGGNNGIRVIIPAE